MTKIVPTYSNLFVKKDFISHSGEKLSWKIECDALTEDDLECFAHIIAQKVTFKDVKGVPSSKGGVDNGGRIAKHLQQYCDPKGSVDVLIVDDVYTTGKSIEEFSKNIIGIKTAMVLFARNTISQPWISSIFILNTNTNIIIKE